MWKTCEAKWKIKIKTVSQSNIGFVSVTEAGSNRMFSLDVTAAMFVSLNKETAGILVSPTNPPGIELCSYANVSFVLVEKHAH